MLIRRGTVAMALTLMLAPAAAQDPPRFRESVHVDRILIDVRAYDPKGQPLLGLEPANFEVRIDGRPAQVESAQHISRGAVAAPPTPGDVPAQAPGADRLIVFLFQRSLHESRIPGMIQMLRELQQGVDRFSSSDRVAVLRFDSSLQLLLDFTADRDRIRRTFAHDVLFTNTVYVSEQEAPSLGSLLEREAQERSFSIERALLQVAAGLDPIPGPKSLVIIGHGFGRLDRVGVSLDPDYDKARDALRRARASVFCLDITSAVSHSLERGLQAVADDTGGLYERTSVFSLNALNRVLAALEGQYVLFVEKPSLDKGTHKLRVRLRGRDGRVLAPQEWTAQQ